MIQNQNAFELNDMKYYLHSKWVGYLRYLLYLLMSMIFFRIVGGDYFPHFLRTHLQVLMTSKTTSEVRLKRKMNDFRLQMNQPFEPSSCYNGAMLNVWISTQFPQNHSKTWLVSHFQGLEHPHVVGAVKHIDHLEQYAPYQLVSQKKIKNFLSFFTSKLCCVKMQDEYMETNVIL